MSTVTWSTAPIPARCVEVGDRVSVDGHDGTVAAVYAAGGSTRIVLTDRPEALPWTGDRLPVQVHVPDEPVDGYTLWRPKPTTWVSGCICVHRRHPTLASNWEQISWDTDCPEHGIHDQYDY